MEKSDWRKLPFLPMLICFPATMRFMPAGKTADIVHWSHSGYHVRDALGAARNDPRAIEAGLRAAVNKMWAALDEKGLMVSVHETRDNSDGIRSQIGPVSRKYCGRLDDVPEQIAARIGNWADMSLQ